jgi:hypothetical protein
MTAITTTATLALNDFVRLTKVLLAYSEIEPFPSYAGMVR